MAGTKENTSRRSSPFSSSLPPHPLRRAAKALSAPPLRRRGFRNATAGSVWFALISLPLLAQIVTLVYFTARGQADFHHTGACGCPKDVCWNRVVVKLGRLVFVGLKLLFWDVLSDRNSLLVTFGVT